MICGFVRENGDGFVEKIKGFIDDVSFVVVVVVVVVLGGRG